MALEKVGVIASGKSRESEVRGCDSDVMWVRVEGGGEEYGLWSFC